MSIMETMVETKIGLTKVVDKTLGELVEEGYVYLYGNYKTDLTISYDKFDNTIIINNLGNITIYHMEEIRHYRQKDVVQIIERDLFPLNGDFSVGF